MQRAVYHPWPGEKLNFPPVGPSPGKGQSLTIESASLELTPGIRMGRGQLTINLRSSQSALHPIDLPPGARLEEVLVDGALQAARAEGHRVRVSIAPGAHEIIVRYHEPRGLESPVSQRRCLRWRARYELPRQRGAARRALAAPRRRPSPRTGDPAVGLPRAHRFAAFLLPRLPLTTLEVRDWFLLGSVSPRFRRVRPCWSRLVLRDRLTDPLAHVRGARKDVGQLLLLLYTLAFLTTLTVAVYQGLVSSPDMEVEGAGSSTGSWCGTSTEARGLCHASGCIRYRFGFGGRSCSFGPCGSRVRCSAGCGPRGPPCSKVASGRHPGPRRERRLRPCLRPTRPKQPPSKARKRPTTWGGPASRSSSMISGPGRVSVTPRPGSVGVEPARSPEPDDEK